MKIAMLSVHSCPLGRVGEENTGGMSVYVREVARELGKRGHRVDVYTRSHPSIHDRVIELGHNARLIHLRAGGEALGKLEIYEHLDDFARSLEEFTCLNGLRYDLLHSHYWLSGIAARRWEQSPGLPHVIGFHTLGAVKNAVGIGGVEPELRVNAERDLVRECHRIIASTRSGKEDLIHYYGAAPAKVSIVPCGVNTALFRPIARDLARSRTGLNGEGIILYVGRIVPQKGVDKLLEAVSYVRASRRTKLVVIGGGESSHTEARRLKHLAQTLNINDAVVFPGLIAHDELPFYYSAADVCVVPSFHETFGLVVLESLACGTPVVATRVGGAENVVKPGKTGYLVKSNDPHCLAEGLMLLLEARRHDGLAAIRASVAGYSWAKVARDLVAEYRVALEFA